MKKITAALVAVLALVGCTSTTLKSDAGQDISDARLSAANVCEKFVGRRLKAPGGASYRDPTGDQITYSGDGDGPITVSASVDSENGFGAKVRSPYTCVVTHGSGDTWNLVNLDLQDGGG